MPEQTESEARQRVLDAALSCFAANGYQATRIADIEEAAGLSPGAGGTYRHFPSKAAMLEAAVEDALREHGEYLAPTPTSMLDAALGNLEVMGNNHDLLRVLLRDLDRFPELHERVTSELLDATFDVAAERTGIVAPDEDYEAIAAVVGSAMFGLVIHRALFGRAPLEVTDERFAAAWAHLLNLLIADVMACADDSDDTDTTRTEAEGDEP